MSITILVNSKTSFFIHFQYIQRNMTHICITQISIYARLTRFIIWQKKLYFINFTNICLKNLFIRFSLLGQLLPLQLAFPLEFLFKF